MRGSGLCFFLLGLRCRPGAQRGACLLCCLSALPLACFTAPYPPSPLPRRGRGRIKVFLCKGLRPLHPQGWAGHGTGSAGVGGTRRGAYLLCRLPDLLLALLLPPSPRPPSPPGKGENQSFLMQGASPLASPELGGTRHLHDQRFLFVYGGQCRQPRRGGTGGEELRRLRWSSPPGQDEQVPRGGKPPLRTPQRQGRQATPPLRPPPGT